MTRRFILLAATAALLAVVVNGHGDMRKRLVVPQFINNLINPSSNVVENAAGPAVVDDAASVVAGPAWPISDYGDVSGVAVHPNNEVFLLHRFDRKWQPTSFNDSHFYQDFALGPITVDPLVGLNAETGRKMHSWGRERFYLPHGLTIDSNGSFWITDVALHQVFRVQPQTLEIDLALGTAGVPGSDDTHFCKPTDVAVSSTTGDVFVADGYCNARIMKFDSRGKLLGQFGKQSNGGADPEVGTFSIPHSLVLVEDEDLLCVADRENRRVQCFDAGLKKPKNFGTFRKDFHDKALGRVFAVDYDPTAKKLYVLSGPDFESLEAKPQASITRLDINGDIRRSGEAWVPPITSGLAHDLALSNGGSGAAADASGQQTCFYMTEIGSDDSDTGRLWKFINL